MQYVIAEGKGHTDKFAFTCFFSQTCFD